MSGIETVLAIASTAFSVASTMAQAKAERRTADYHAAIAENDAADIRAKSAAEEDKYRRQAQKLLGRQRALIGNAGVRLEGSPLLAQEETAAQAELDALTIRHDGDIQAARKMNEAMLSRLKGRNAMKAGYLSVGKTLLGQASNLKF